MAGKPWSKEELDLLKTYGPTEGCKYVADKTGRTIRSVQHKFRQLGLIKSKAKIGDIVNGWKIVDIYIKDCNNQKISMAIIQSTISDVKKEYRLTLLTNKKIGWPDRRRPDVVIKNTTHGMSNSKLYKIHHAMKTRCTNPNQDCYKNYGGRGITLCKEWMKFENFYDWAINNGYEEGLSIDRIDVDGNYESSNCRWTTPQEQAWNRRNTIKEKVTAFGETKTIHEWVDDDRCMVSSSTLCYRIGAGKDPEEAITKPSERKSNAEGIYSLEFCRYVHKNYPEIVEEFTKNKPA